MSVDVVHDELDDPRSTAHLFPWLRVNMAVRQAESVIKNIIKEITIEASRRGQDVSETLAAFLVSSTDRRHGYDMSFFQCLMSTVSPSRVCVRCTFIFFSRSADIIGEVLRM